MTFDGARAVRVFVRRRALLIVAVAVLPVAIRVLVLPWFPVPTPRVPDEYSHLLVADTLGSGRLANVTHPLWRHFETAYVLHAPAYASIYPIGQGAAIAVGALITGHPWGGVLLSVALMSGAIVWMLYGCVPAGWAILGGLIAALHFGLAPQWVSSYWGGAFCAFGGALLFGALVRLRSGPSKAMGAIAGVGWSIGWLIRPYESLPLFAFVWLVLTAIVIGQRPQWREWLAPLVLLASVQLLAGGVTVLHNHAVTSSSFTLPYRLNQRFYGTPQSFFWQEPVPAPDVRVPELASLFEWQRKQKEDLDEHPIRQFGRVVRDFASFYVTWWYALPVVMLLLVITDISVLIGIGLVGCAVAVSAMYPIFLPHYVAAYTCVVGFLITRGLMRLSAVSIGRIPAGRVLAGLLIVGGALSAEPFRTISTTLATASTDVEPPWLREQLVQRLDALGGRHVVFVQYDPGHSFHDEWVYNAATIDDASIVWCRAMGEAEDGDVVRYYEDRTFWLAVVDDNGAHVYRYGLHGAEGTPVFTLGS
jgi:hypothetical protein